jgi:hypothetical protein
MFEELEMSTRFGGVGGFLPGMKQIANVAALPGIVGVCSRTINDTTHIHTNIQIYTLIFDRNLSACLMCIRAMDLLLVIWLHLTTTIHERLSRLVASDSILIAVFVFYERI